MSLRSAEAARRWIAEADDTTYSDHVNEATAASPRFEVGDLYGPLAVARAERPVHACSQWDLAGVGRFHKMSAFENRPLYAAVSFAAVQECFGDGVRFSSTIHNETIGLVWGETLLGMDDPEHRLQRGLIAQAFTRAHLDRWERGVVEPVVDGLIDRFVADGHADLSAQFTMLFPVYVIAELLGLPREDVPQFMSWVADTIVIFHDAPRALAASAALKDYLGAVIDERRSEPSDDLISLLVGAELEGERLSTDHIVNFLRLLLPAGGETTYRSSGNLLFALLSDPEQLTAVDRDRELLQPAIEEGLRWEPPLTSVNRLCTVDTELDGVPVPAGAIVECSMAGANRDPSRWEDPDRFDINRAPKPHLAFAFGPHTCIGMHLARLETRVALTHLLDRLANLRFDPDYAGPAPEIRGIGFRSPTRLPVRFDAR